ncbi:Negative elongation factor E-like protein [Leptotrombidium deliense]|uniref:Negative elongation factor E n=1 Tax=Leptotrombidium deliense TaxID=299467 RepID=A0A443S455_9ACAR|nr:Negative elongation factor E-like protein [Leptotrombidium deliense]
MVFIQIPSSLTEEEKTLQQKYQKLKRKARIKKALQALKAPKTEPTPIQQQLKRVSETSKQDAKEVAKKLLKSGAISAIKVPDKDKQKGLHFKRPKSGRKDSTSEKPGGYQPFSSVHSHDSETDFSSIPSDSGLSLAARNRFKSLSESFVLSSDSRDEGRDRRKGSFGSRELPETGHTIYVSGLGVNDGILSSGFSPFGTIVNINVESRKNCGFVTFDTVEQAKNAINEMNGKTVDGIKLEVSLARRQPMVHSNETSSSNETKDAWRRLADNYSRESKGTPKEKRSIVTYDDL